MYFYRLNIFLNILPRTALDILSKELFDYVSYLK